MRVARVLPAAFVSLAACSLFVDTSGLADGTSATQDGGGRDAPSGGDATPGADSGASGDDAAGEAGVDAAADARKPCPPGGFCDDFDQGALGATWSNKNEDRGTVSLGTDALTPPNALRIDVNPVNFQGSVSLVKSIAPAPMKVRCEVDLKLPAAAPSKGEVDYIDFIMKSGPGHHVYLASFSGVFDIAEFADFPDGGTAIDRTVDVPPPAIGKWVHVTFETDGSSATLSYDGVVQGTLGGLSTPTATTRDLAFGATYSSSTMTTAFAIEMDDVACSFPP